MLRSMTGFGGSQGVVEGVEYAIETRAVNNRYFKAIIKLPDSWANAESDVEKLIRARISRGTVALTLRMKFPTEQSAYRVNIGALQAYVDQLRPLQADLNPALRIDLGVLMQLPGVCEPPELDELCKRCWPAVSELIQQAIANLLLMRQKEGQLLKADLLAQCDAIGKNLATVGERSPLVVKDYHARLTARVAELTAAAKVKIDEDTLAREVAIYAERCDVAEEIARLSGHIEHFRQAVADPEPAGRKLDFIAQEMLREANTIGSKANDAEIARAVVNIKTAVDRIKEQVQNAE